MELTEEFAWQGRTVRWARAGSGPDVVFCHGTPWSSRLWAPYAEALATEFTVHLWDMPGYGASSMSPEHDVDLGVQGEVLAALLPHWGLVEPHVVAHDFGGAVALRAHLLHGARYASLALVDVVALRPWGSPYFRLVAANADTFAAQPAHVHAGALAAYVRSASHRGLGDEDLAMLTGPWETAEGQAAFYRQIGQADERFTAEVEDRYAELDLPVLVVWGADDTWIPVDRAERLAATIPGASLEVIADAGHLIQLDQPVALATSLHRWLVRQTEVCGARTRVAIAGLVGNVAELAGVDLTQKPKAIPVRTSDEIYTSIVDSLTDDHLGGYEKAMDRLDTGGDGGGAPDPSGIESEAFTGQSVIEQMQSDKATGNWDLPDVPPESLRDPADDY